MKPTLLAFVAAAAFLFPATASARPARSPWINLIRTDCFGPCPVFAVRVFADGRVEYKGKRFVMRRGVATRQLASAELTKLRRAVADAKVDTLAPDCCKCRGRTDDFSTFLEIAAESGLKTIDHYHGCQSAPDSVSVLEDAIISISGAAKWVGSDAERSRQKWKR